ncbi:MAG: GNAT family N-acetyltransferase [Candidatus Taylorbacteria bacterium]|nr:GNAT family N-acetyltransferase [Candidatus Taylorbacteria bacterium]
MKLVLPSIEYEESFRGYLKELETLGRSATEVDSETLFKQSSSFEDFVTKLRAGAEGKFLPEGYVPHTTYWLVEGERFIGGVNIRHRLTDHLREIGGHIGYAIRPSERGKGYGNKILELALPKAKELGIIQVRITCNEDNIASRKIIEKNGGVFDGTATTPDGTIKRRYWITKK